jgi:2-keto-4-pentenoate hydratase/2-oxohepta-3-ene-1,7-dioic acid hydratase in catechol pathway
VRLASVLLDGRPRLAGRTAAGLFDLTGQDSALTGVSDVLAEEDGLDRAAAALDRADRVGPTLVESALRWRPLLTSAGKVLALGLNYADHAAESPYDRPDYPVVFPRFTTSLLGHGEPICRPVDSDQLDFEGELVAVIGRTARRVPVDEALQAVAGYSLFNDATIRDFQFRTISGPSGRTSTAPGRSARNWSRPTSSPRARRACGCGRPSTTRSCRTRTPPTCCSRSPRPSLC